MAQKNIKKTFCLLLVSLILLCSTFLFIPSKSLKIEANDQQFAKNNGVIYKSASQVDYFDVLTIAGTTLFENLVSSNNFTFIPNELEEITISNYLKLKYTSKKFYPNTYDIWSVKYEISSLDGSSTIKGLKICINDKIINWKMLKKFNVLGLNVYGIPNSTIKYTGSYSIGIDGGLSIFPISYTALNESNINLMYPIQLNIDKYPYIYINDYTIEVLFNEPVSKISFGDYYIPVNTFVSLPDFIEEYSITLQDDFDISSFLVNSVGGFLNFELIPNLSIGGIFGLLAGICILFAILKLFFGG